MTQPAIDPRAIPPAAVEARWTAADGHPIRRIDWAAPAAAPRGSLLFLPGRGDCYEKYLETLDHWHRQGWQVTALDWRGQAGSGRFGLDQTTGHIDDFGTWTADLAAFWAEWIGHTPGPHVAVGHSMGGHLLLRAMAERAIAPAAAVLSTPMLGYAASVLPQAVMHQAAKVIAALGDRRRPAWQAGETPGAAADARPTMLTHDDRRYSDELWWRTARPETAMGPGSWGWVERGYASMRWLARREVLAQVKQPLLLLCADHDRLVSAPAIIRAAGLLPHAQLVRFGREARHEMLREVDAVRDRVLAAITNFLDQAAPAPR